MVFRPQRTVLLGTLIVTIVGLRFAWPAMSAPISGNAVQKLTVYQGAVTIAPGTPGASTFEFGNAGRDLASTGNILLRPGSTTSLGTTSRFIGGGGPFQSLSMSGDFRVFTAGQQVCLMGDPTPCRSAWGSAAGGLWNELTSPTRVEPTDLTRGVRIGTAASRFTNGTALNAPWGFTTRNLGGDPALTIEGSVYNAREGAVYGSVKVNGLPVYHRLNDGEGSGFDADKLDGVEATLTHGKWCRGAVCLCFSGIPRNHTFSYSWIDECLRFETYPNGGPGPTPI